ncbi:MAG: hypothetical protein ABL956_14665 [Hyphomonadaceae bacterium]
MRGAAFERFRMVSGVAAAALLSACVSNATAQIRPATTWTARKDCIVSDIIMPAASRYADMVRDCSTTAEDPNEKGGNQAIAAYNAARAYIALADDQPATSSANYIAAVRSINRSLDRLRNDHPDLTRPAKPNDKNDGAIVLTNQKFRYGRVYELGRAYAGLAQSQPAVTAQSTGGLCAGKDGCLTEAVRHLESRDVATPFANDPADTRYDDFVLLRASAYAQLGLAADGGKARSDFEELVRRAGMPGRGQIVEKAKAELAKIYVRDGQLALQGQNAANLGIAIDSFQKALGVDPNALEAKLGLGRAYTALAVSSATGKREGYVSAASAYESAAITAADRGLVRQQAEAREGRGQALLELSRLSAASGGSDATGLLQQAIDEYTAAAGLEPNNAERQLKLARALDRAGQFARADRAFEAAVRLLSPGPLLSDALLELAAVKAKLPEAGPEVIRATYEKARAANPQSAKPGFEIGMSYFKQGSLANAAKEFEQVIDRTGGLNGIPQPGELQMKADAYYYLSLIEARQAGSGPLPASAVSNADRSVLVGAPNTPRNFACLVHIMRGGKSVTDDGMSNWCSGSDGKPEGLLLRGMFYLRQAQIASQSARPILRDSAQFAFNQGLNETKRLTTPPVSSDAASALQVTFEWPGAPKPPSVQVLLDYGKAVVVGCGSPQTALTTLSATDAAAAESFYKFYRVYDCEARR